MSYFSKFYEKKKSKLKGNKFIERVNGLRQNNKKAFAMSSIAAMLLVPIISIFIYKVISEPFYVKKIVSETVAETISDQPEFMVKTLVKEDGLSEQERNELLNQMTDKMNEENQPITNDLEVLKTDLLYLKDQPVQVPGNQVTNINFEELLEKIQAGTATKEDIEALLSMIEYLKSSLGTKAEQEELENLRLLLEKMQNGAVTETDLTEVKDSLGALKEEIDKIKEEMSKGLEQSNSGLEEKINKITIRIDELEKAISDNHYTKDEMDVIIGDINLAIDDINHNSLVEINTKIDEINNKTLVEINTAINNIKNETLTTINSKLEEITNNITNSNAGLNDEIDKILVKINDLEVGIANNHYTKAEINVMVAEINAAIDDINNNSLVEINTKIEEITNNITNSNVGIKDDIDKVIDKIDDLEVSIANNHYTKAEIDVKVTSINAAIDDINDNSLVKINAGIDDIKNNLLVKISEDIEDINNNSLVKINKNIGNLNSLSSTNKTSLVDAMNEVFQSVSSGKILLASAITDKGINADASESFENLSNKIKLITGSTLTGNIKYTYHVHVAGCSTRCPGTVRKYNTRWHNEHKYYIYDYRCSQCAFDTEHHRTEPGDYQCEVVSLTCGKTTNTIEKAEIVFGDTKSRSALTKLDIDEIIRHNELEQMNAEQDSSNKETASDGQEEQTESTVEESTDESSAEQEESDSSDESSSDEGSSEENTIEDQTEEESTEESTQESTMESQVLPNKLVTTN